MSNYVRFFAKLSTYGRGEIAPLEANNQLQAIRCAKAAFAASTYYQLEVYDGHPEQCVKPRLVFRKQR